ncbi:MAG TPA: RNA polymerase sigma-54 factor [Polyangiaceae bacterium]|nr:RNA polymerase sigma-54 factor [Polyangiaceae bacterium]
MGMEMKLQVKLSQQLVMTPQLVQAIRLLQLSRMELVEEVRKELDGNPVLADDNIEPQEQRQSTNEQREKNAAEAEKAEKKADKEKSEAEKAAEQQQETANKEDEIDWQSYLENQQLRQPVGASRQGFEDLPPIEQNLTKPESLRDHLLWQLQMSDFVDTERHFALLVIGNLDDKGYLDLEGGVGPDGEKLPDLTIEDLADEADLDHEDAVEVLKLIQRFDPVGVAARNLQECLLIQAEVLGFDDVEKTIIKNHLKDVERRNLNAIVKALDIDMEEVIDAVQEIQKLESVPARNFSEIDERTIAITPDVFVVKDEDKFIVTDNDRGMQRLYINESLVKKMMKDPKAKDFINDKLRSAQWLIRAIEQRRRTIIKVTECIVEKQREFLEKGVAYLKPMILRDVAEAVGMHESTISRVTSNKYVHTPQGLFELKYFFNSSISRVGEEDIASESVKQAIKQIIAEENKEKPLSDQAIVKKLKAERGIKIARRTVAKYREMMGILSSAKRKNLF